MALFILSNRGLAYLLQYVLDRQLHETVTSGFSDQEQQLLVFYAQNYSPDRLSHISANPPNHVISLTNWEIMTSLLRRVGPAQQQSHLICDKFVTRVHGLRTLYQYF